MNKSSAVNYIIPPPSYLWRWDDDHSSIQWTGDATVCVWEELHALLHFLAPQGLPPAGSMLMVLMACRQKAAVVFHDAMRFSGAVTGGDEPSATSRRLLLRLKEVLEQVQALPAELRTGLSARAHLLRTLFEGVMNRQPPAVSTAILEQIDIWGIEDLSGETSRPGGGPRLLRDLKAMASVYEARDLPRLESLLRVGLEDVNLQPAPVPEPKPEPGESLLPLLQQLEQHRDTELAAIAAAARRIVAMFSLPRPAGHPQELPVGGISDITNRGPLDRLLPGELAYDDLTLSARLANNEALYFRRDTPPDEPATERVVLMDSGVHLWGTPRVFALAAALGLQAGAAKGEDVRLYRREGGSFRPLLLGSVAAVRECLATLPAAPNPEEALRRFEFDAEAKPRPDVFFISVAQPREPVRQALHALALRAAEAGGRFYVLTIGRGGALELSVRSAAGTRVLAAGRIDPDTIFGTTPATEDKPAVKAAEKLFHLPEVVRHLGFYRKWPLPFRFPAVPIMWSEPLRIDDATLGVSPDRRLMRWDSSCQVGIELASQIPQGRRYSVYRHGHNWVVVVSGSTPGSKVRAVVVNDENGQSAATVLDSSHPFPVGQKVMHGAVILVYSDKAEACALDDGRRLDSIPLPRGVSPASVGFDGRKLHTSAPMKAPAPPRTENQERPPLPSLMMAPLSAGFDSGGRLVVRATGGRWELLVPELIFKKSAKASLSAVRPFTAVGTVAESDPPPVPAFYVAEWNADCRLIFDTRGVLHIVFHDMHGLVEIALLCLLDVATAAWVRHWPEEKQHLGARAWFLDASGEPQPAVNLTPLLQRFSAMAREAGSSAQVNFVPHSDTTFTRNSAVK